MFRSIAFPISLWHRNLSTDAISHRALSRSFSSYSQPFPYYEEPVGRYQTDPFPRHYVDRVGYESDPNFGQFHRHQFSGEYGPYHHPVRVSWRGYGSECCCRCCGRPFWGYGQQYPPVNYGAGNYGVVGVNGTGYGHGVGYQMRSGYSRNAAAAGFDGSDGRSLGYGGNSCYYSRNPNGNVGQHGQNWGDGSYDRRGGAQEKWSEEQKIAHDGGRDGRDRNAWSQSRSNYNLYGPERSAYNESNEFHQRNGYVEQKNSHTGDQTRLEYNGRSGGGQPQDATVNGQPMTSDGASDEFQHSRQSPRISDVLRNETSGGSHEGNKNVNMQTSSNDNQAGVWGNYGHQNLYGRFVKQDSVDVGYQQTRDGGNMYGPLPDFAATDRPLKPNVLSADTNKMPNNNGSRYARGSLPHSMVDAGNDASHRSHEAAGRCQRIIDVLETEDKHVPNGPEIGFSVKK